MPGEADSDTEVGLSGLGAPSKKPTTLPWVAATLTDPLSIVESAEAAPTADATTASEKWEAAGQDAIARWIAR